MNVWNVQKENILLKYHIWKGKTQELVKSALLKRNGAFSTKSNF